MNYPKIYDSLINKARSREVQTEKTEEHHILPSCLGGSDTPENMVLLTLQEHFVAHFLLAKIHGGKLWWAFNMMSNFRKYGSKKYAFLKEKVIMSEEHKNKIRVALLSSRHGRILSQECRDKISRALKGKPKPPVSDESRSKMSKAQKSRKRSPHSEETKRKQSEASLGRKKSEDAKKHMSEAWALRRAKITHL